MELVITYLQSILYVLLVLSGAALLFLTISFALRQKARAKQIDLLAKSVGIVSTVGTFFLSLINVFNPLGILPEPDEGKVVIERFYNAVQKGNFDNAWALLHRTRIEEIRRTIPNFNRDKFAETYATTREYKNLSVKPLLGGEQLQSRAYVVSFDVRDELPRNRLYEYRRTLVGDLSQQGLINIDQLVNVVLANLRDFYEVHDTSIPAIREFIMTRQFESLLEPNFLSEVRRNLSLQSQIELKPKQIKTSTIDVWRHYVQDLQLLRENGSWKIRHGLAQPRTLAVYLQATPP